mgnify:CR=1 FL=1
MNTTDVKEQIEKLEPMVYDPLLTAAQVKVILQTSLTNLYALIKSGKLVATNIGRGKRRSNWRIKKSDLDSFLFEGEQTKPNES